MAEGGGNLPPPDMIGTRGRRVLGGALEGLFFPSSATQRSFFFFTCLEAPLLPPLYLTVKIGSLLLSLSSFFSHYRDSGCE